MLHHRIKWLLFKCDRLKPALVACGFKELNCQSFDLKMRSIESGVTFVVAGFVNGFVLSSLRKLNQSTKTLAAS